jgi:hypothetical protein
MQRINALLKIYNLSTEAVWQQTDRSGENAGNLPLPGTVPYLLSVSYRLLSAIFVTRWGRLKIDQVSPYFMRARSKKALVISLLLLYSKQLGQSMGWK